MQSKGTWGEGVVWSKKVDFILEKGDGLDVIVVVTPSLRRDGMVFRGYVLPLRRQLSYVDGHDMCRRLFSMPTAAVSPTCPTPMAYLGRRPCCWAARLGTSTDGVD
jgi:hypothetical protein